MKIVYRLKDITDNNYLYLDYMHCENEIIFILDKRSGICLYETESLKNAKEVRSNRVNNPSRINYTTYESPVHTYNVNDIKIVKVNIEEKEDIDDTAPNDLDNLIK